MLLLPAALIVGLGFRVLIPEDAGSAVRPFSAKSSNSRNHAIPLLA